MINNKSIEYRIIKTSMKLLDSNRIELPKTFIEVFLTDSIRNALMRFSYKDWITLLCDKNTDWAANLCLHDIFHRNASLYRLEMNREKWLNCCDLNDRKYWKKNLRNLIAKNKTINKL